MRYQVSWHGSDGELVAREPTDDEVLAAAPALAAAYNDPHNRSMMAHEEEMSVEEVVAHYRDMGDAGARQLLLYKDGVLAGDADLRNIDGGAAEFAILVAARAAQGRGLGTRFAVMAHALAFRALGLRRVYVTILPANAASRRLFEKIGYRVDDSPAARAYIDDETDLSLSISREEFERAWPTALAEIRVGTV